MTEEWGTDAADRARERAHRIVKACVGGGFVIAVMALLSSVFWWAV